MNQKLSTESKKVKVEAMFNDIAPKYDFLNHFLSLGIDIRWRKKVRRLIAPLQPRKILDIATGTGDLAIELTKLTPKKIIGLDIAAQMLEIGQEKIKSRKLDHLIEMQLGDSENLPFDDNSFDAVTVAFGVRNFENLEQGLREMYRVLRPGGIAAILEFSKPRAFPFRQIYNFYFRYILPPLGRMVSNNKEAYTYLPESVNTFPEDADFLQELAKAGFTGNGQQRLTMGVATLYRAFKK